MTTKKKFDVVDPEVTVLRNGRYAFKAQCPWEGKNGKILTAFKFCSAEAYKKHQDRNPSESKRLEESKHLEESEQIEELEEP